MTPLDFLFTTPEKDYNGPAGKYAATLNEDITILSKNSEWKILSYRMGEDGAMILDIERKK